MTDTQRIWSIVIAVLIIVSGGYLLAYINAIPVAWWTLPTQIFTIIAMIASGIFAFLVSIDN